MVLCFGTYASILKNCCPKSVTNRTLVSAIVGTIDPENKYGDKDDNTPAFCLLNCEANFPHMQYASYYSSIRSSDGAISKVVEIARLTNVDDIASKFDGIIALLDADKKKAAVGALYDLIKNDASLASAHRETFIQCMGMAAEELVALRKINPVKFLAGLFLYTVLTNDNKSKEAKLSVKAIQQSGYVDSFADFDVEFEQTDEKTQAIPGADTVGEYLSALKAKYGSLKTLLYYDEPRPFYDFYVCNDIERRVQIQDANGYPYQYRVIQNATAATIGESCRYAIISAYGGMGKSMMMRHFLLSAVNDYDTHEKLPIFIQLKDYTEGNSARDLLLHIYDATPLLQAYFSLDELKSMLGAGKCLILLDGLDELGSVHQSDFEKALERFIDAYPNNQYIMSSRPFTDFVSFGRFTTWRLSAFSNEQALELISKLEFRPDDETIKEKFILTLREKLFETHPDFVSNPLLLTIMLMTFSQIAEISQRMHIFYADAYAVLAQKHDASKGAFKRQLKTGLTSEQFADYFAEFCARSYTGEKYEMTEDEAKKYFYDLNEHRKHPDKNVSAADFLYDLCSNMCLMFIEGGKYHFTHRSFQEYFCALYFSGQKDKNLEKIGEFFEKSRMHFFATQTFGMLYDMIPEKVEEYIFMPFLDRLTDACDKNGGYLAYLEAMYPTLFYDVENDSTSMDDADPHSFTVDFILRHIGASWDKPYIAAIPVYEEFLVHRLAILQDGTGDLADIEEIDKQYIEKHGMPEISICCYKLDTKNIIENHVKYKQMLDIFMRPDFPPMLQYHALIDYKNILHNAYDNSPNNIFDFL